MSSCTIGTNISRKSSEGLSSLKAESLNVNQPVGIFNVLLENSVLSLFLSFYTLEPIFQAVNVNKRNLHHKYLSRSERKKDIYFSHNQLFIKSTLFQYSAIHQPLIQCSNAIYLTRVLVVTSRATLRVIVNVRPHNGDYKNAISSGVKHRLLYITIIAVSNGNYLRYEQFTLYSHIDRRRHVDLIVKHNVIFNSFTIFRDPIAVFSLQSFPTLK